MVAAFRAEISGSCGENGDTIEPKNSCDSSAGEVTVGGLESRIDDSYRFVDIPGRAGRRFEDGVGDEYCDADADASVDARARTERGAVRFCSERRRSGIRVNLSGVRPFLREEDEDAAGARSTSSSSNAPDVGSSTRMRKPGGEATS